MFLFSNVEALHLRAREPTHHSASHRRHLAKSRAADGGDPTAAGTGMTEFGQGTYTALGQVSKN